MHMKCITGRLASIARPRPLIRGWGQTIRFGRGGAAPRRYVAAKQERAGPDYIITITTIPPRIRKIEKVIRSFLNQTIKPAMIVINVPYEYDRFKGARPEMPEYLRRGQIAGPGVLRLSKYNEVYINRCKHDYGPATKLLGLTELGITLKKGTMILVTDDDSVKKSNWATTLTDNIRNNPAAVSTIHHRDVYGGRGFGFYNGALTLNDVLAVYRRVWSQCNLVDDDMLTHYCRYRGVPLSCITGVYPLHPETEEFTHKLRDLGGESERGLLKRACRERFKELCSMKGAEPHNRSTLEADRD
jgi:hypothetical protein